MTTSDGDRGDRSRPSHHRKVEKRDMTGLTPEEQELIETYGPLYRFAPFKRGDTIKYRVPGFDGIYIGEVLWTCAPGELAGHQLPLRYVVHCEQRGFVDVVFTVDIIRDEPT